MSTINLVNEQYENYIANLAARTSSTNAMDIITLRYDKLVSWDFNRPRES